MPASSRQTSERRSCNISLAKLGDARLAMAAVGFGKKMKKRASLFATRDLGASLRHWPAIIKLYTLNFRRIDNPAAGANHSIPVPRKDIYSSGDSFSDLPFLVLLRVASYLSLSELAVLLQLPSRRIRAAALSIVSGQLHEIKDLASLHSLLSYRGMVPYFYRSSALLLFGRHFTRVLPEAWNVMGPLYACFLFFFMVSPSIVFSI